MFPPSPQCSVPARYARLHYALGGGGKETKPTTNILLKVPNLFQDLTEPSRFVAGRNGLECRTFWRLLALVAAANRDGSRSDPELDAALPRWVPSRNTLGFLPSRHNLLLNKWLSNPNRSSARKSSASRCGPSACRSAWGTGSPNSSIGPASSPLGGRMISRKPPCSRTSSPTSSAACSAIPVQPGHRTPSPSPANGTSRW